VSNYEKFELKMFLSNLVSSSGAMLSNVNGVITPTSGPVIGADI